MSRRVLHGRSRPVRWTTIPQRNAADEVGLVGGEHARGFHARVNTWLIALEMVLGVLMQVAFRLD